MEKRIKDLMAARRKEGLLREIFDVEPFPGGKAVINGKDYVNFSSNDYLSLSYHPDIVEAMRSSECGVPASSSSRLMTGTRPEHSLLEERVAEFKGKESALIFNSGYQANLGIISAICSRGGAVICDKLSHASIIDGIKLSGAKLFRFRHNDMSHLEELLASERGRYDSVLIITETVFSMDGDIPDLKTIIDFKKKYNCMLMLDEAHATGIFGSRGSGLAERDGIVSDADILMGTFSKALGGFGAYAAVSSAMKEYLINTSRSLIYSTALPVPIISADIAALKVVEDEPFRREKLLDNSEYVRTRLKEEGFDVIGESQIIPILVGGNDETLLLSNELKERGYWVMAVRPPTVPKGGGRIRISLNYDHSREVIDNFIDVLIETRGKLKYDI